MKRSASTINIRAPATVIDHIDTRERIIEQARELELDFFYSAKSHFKAAWCWDKFGFWLGLTSIIVSSIDLLRKLPDLFS